MVTESGSEEGGCSGELGRMGDQKEGGIGVEARYPDQTAPADVVTGPVQRDVQRREIARLPPEELADVDALQQDVGHVTGVPHARLPHRRQ